MELKPDWRAGVLTLLTTSVCLALWIWSRLALLDAPPQVHSGVTPWMLALIALYVGTLLLAMTFTGANLHAPRLAAWALLISLGLFSLITTTFLAVAVWGTPMLSLWTVLSLLGLGSLCTLWFASTLWRAWQADHARLKLADHDLLTGLLNRQGLLHYLPASLSGTLVVLDVNQLKIINDLHGHTVGDQQIGQLAQVLQQFASPALAARWGGDEFLLLCPDQSAQQVQSRLLELQQRLPSLTGPLPLFSFGLTSLQPGQTFEQAFALADHQLYLTKGNVGASSPKSSDQLDLLDLTQRLAHLRTPAEIFQAALSHLRHMLHFEAGVVLRLHDQRLWLQHVDRSAILPPLDHPPTGLSAFSGCHAQAIEGRRTVLRVDYPNDPDALPEIVALGIKSVVMTPILIAGEVKGLLVFSQHTTWKAIPLTTVRLLELAATQLSHLLELHFAVRTVRRTLEGGLLGLGAALEARDLETRGHTERVVALAMKLGHHLHLTEGQLDELRQGAYLHDIGKLSIPDRILLKPGPLEADEWDLMKTHVAQGVTIAQRMPDLSTGAIDVIRAHHERWDGQGYPAGLVGEEIPFLARIFAVCDTYDALTSVRPYKAAWTEEKAREEIASLMNRQFCPEVVEAFLSLSPGEVKESEEQVC